MTLELHNRFRDVIVGFSGAIPAVGTFVSTLLGVFWPARERDIWEQIRHEVEALVNKRVLESELESRRNQLDGFKRNLQAYHDAIGLQKSQALTNLLFDARAIEPFMIGNNANRIHFIPMAAAFAFQHIGVLIEQFQFGAELYGQFNPTWRVDLETTHSRYATFFNTTLPLWRSWRVTQIEGTWWRSSSGGGILNPPRYFANGRVFDHVDGHEQTWRREIRDGDYFRPTVEAYIAERTARLFAEMNSIVNPVVNDLRNTIQQIMYVACLCYLIGVIFINLSLYLVETLQLSGLLALLMLPTSCSPFWPAP